MLRWRKMTWVLWIWIALTVLFIVAANSADENKALEECVDESGGSSAAQAGCEIGTEVASEVWTVVGVIVGLLGFFVLSIIWFMTRPRRHCPACGRDAKKGVTVCKKCGYDFAVAARAAVSPAATAAAGSMPPPPPPSLPPP